MDPSPENVLLLLTDQERYDLADPNGLPVETPATDRLREEGRRFERAYTPIGICTSARASLLTGLYPHNHGLLNNCHEPDAVRPNLPAGLSTFGDLLADAGYDNSYVGKWHVGRDQRPADFGFRYTAGDASAFGHDDPEFHAFQRRMGVDPDAVEVEDATRIDYGDRNLLLAGTLPIPPEATLPAYVADVTIDALSAHADADGPFLHRADFHGPHHPYLVPEPYASMYDPDEIEPWPNFHDDLVDKPGAHREYLRYRGVDELGWDEWADLIAKYFGLATMIEEQIARVLDAVDDLGLTDDLTVVRTADHGDLTGAHRGFNKGPMMYEEVYRIPLTVRSPGLTDPGTTTDAFVRLHDLMPTFLDLADVPIPSGLDARSLVPVLDGDGPDDWPESVFVEYHGDEFGLYTQRMVRTERYKLVYNGPDVNELYDLRDDPAELDNRIDDPAYADGREELTAILIDWMERTDDDWRLWIARSLRRDRFAG